MLSMRLLSPPPTLAASARFLKRNVIVHVVEAGRRLRRRPVRRCGSRARRRRRALVARAAAIAAVFAARGRTGAQAFAATEHLHVAGDDLGRVLLDAILVLPLAGFQAPFDVDRAALLQIFAGDLGKLVVEDDTVPFRLFRFVAGLLVLPAARCRDADVADGAAVGRVANLGVAAEVADDDDFVDRCHGMAPVFGWAGKICLLYT